MRILLIGGWEKRGFASITNASSSYGKQHLEILPLLLCDVCPDNQGLFCCIVICVSKHYIDRVKLKHQKERQWLRVDLVRYVCEESPN